MKYILETQQRLLALYGQEVYTDYLPVEVLLRRASLVGEEAKNLVNAIHSFNTPDTTPEQRAHFLKTLADNIAAIFGAAAQLGFTDEEVEEAYDIVHMDNLSKAYGNKNDAMMAKYYYTNTYPGDFYVKEVPLPPRASLSFKESGELEIGEITYPCLYIVTNYAGRVMGRHPAPATTAEERILQYVTKQKTSQTSK